ncbi:aluminum-activated malate transporter 13-like [Pyrus ussuriensis x Pyrus communis]|uniref:Aluminum-activated malate transporter 13-like n=1 Tax=Pyrus ussuriensis x Pyrus communis TaxID=2448454 RepID=A0A5N5FQB1_9ROSA|nr:aluminum-activated malate transporter 13-like [Pyrus ussuriensis x Pyrus communis]
MGSTVITIPADGELARPKNIQDKDERQKFSIFGIISNLTLRVLDQKSKQDMRKLLHSIKVGVALVLVSLLYLLDPLYEQVGENAMWAIMTVIVIFEFYAGATLSKGLNRGFGTILGGVLGCSAATFAREVGRMGKGNAVIIGSLVFVIGTSVTYFRLVPSIKKRYDYGVMIFILTFNLVIVSGLRAEKVLELARDRLSTIGMGFAVCIFISLLVFPTWASDELHDSTAHKFQLLADSIEGCLENYFRLDKENIKDDQPRSISSRCKSVLHSKSKDETLANFAKWEPWHGKFGLNYPWTKYLQVGELLRELATIVISLKGCLQSPRQPSSSLRQSIEEPCEAVGLTLAWSLREVGENLVKMRRCNRESVIVPKLKSMRLELSSIVSPSKFGPIENVDGLAIASFVFLLAEMVEKVEELAREIEELGELAGFHTK